MGQKYQTRPLRQNRIGSFWADDWLVKSWNAIVALITSKTQKTEPTQKWNETKHNFQSKETRRVFKKSEVNLRSNQLIIKLSEASAPRSVVFRILNNLTFFELLYIFDCRFRPIKFCPIKKESNLKYFKNTARIFFLKIMFSLFPALFSKTQLKLIKSLATD